MNVLSLFDGISCGRVALERAGIHVDNYYASEIDKYAIKVSNANYPDIIQVGDVTQLTRFMPHIDLLLGGSPCQGFSFAGKGLNFNDPRSKLFFEYVRIKNELQPQYFLLENVVMKKEYQDIISTHLGVTPVLINSNLVSAQNRKRLYWTNIPDITQPEDKGVILDEIVDTTGKLLELFPGPYRYRKCGMSDYLFRSGAMIGRKLINGKRADYADVPTMQILEINALQKTNCLTTVAKDNVLCLERAGYILYRYLTPSNVRGYKHYPIILRLP